MNKSGIKTIIVDQLTCTQQLVSFDFTVLRRDRVLQYILLPGSSPSVTRFEFTLQMVLHSFVEHCRFLDCEGRVVHARDIFSRCQVMQVPGQ